jgi:hypothetical protein
LAFLDLNLTDPSKDVILKKIDNSIANPTLMREIQKSLKLLNLAK